MLSVFPVQPTRRLAIAALVAALALFALAPRPAQAGAAKPTVVLVHGAFADASTWSGVTARLQKQGYTVAAPANPLRGLQPDTAYLKDYLATVRGPIVLVGHSYGGMVISNAATGNPNVKALVYVAAFAPDEGDSIASLGALGKQGMLGPATLDFRTFTASDGTQVPEGYVKLNVFRTVFAGDLPKATAAQLAVSQRPIVASALGDMSGPPAWKSIKSFYLLPGADRAIGTDAERVMAKRMGATTVTVKGASHLVMVSSPKETTKLIDKAIAAVR